MLLTPNFNSYSYNIYYPRSYALWEKPQYYCKFISISYWGLQKKIFCWSLWAHLWGSCISVFLNYLLSPSSSFMESSIISSATYLFNSCKCCWVSIFWFIPWNLHCVAFSTQPSMTITRYFPCSGVCRNFLGRRG